VTRGDRIVVAIVALAAVLAWPATMAAAGSARGSALVVSGPSGTSDLALRPDREVEVQGLRGTVCLQVIDGGVRVAEVTCPDRLCQRQGRVSAPGSALVCVPNGMTARIGGGGDALDAVVR
jgi:hypothetical protein